jgi:GAF domain-containing protein
VLACAPLALALLTEGRWAGDARVVFLLAFGLALATGAVLLVRTGDAREARAAAAPERSLRRARDQQAATAEILGAMAASPPDLQRVLDTIARNSARVCEGLYGQVFHFDGSEIRLTAHHGLSPARLAVVNQKFPRGVDDESLVGRAIRDATVLHYPDVPTDPGIPGWVRELAQAEGFRSAVVVPLLQDGRALGAIHVSRPESGFTERQIALLRTFADQAVIAIENVRLFQELEGRNRALTEALERETATSGILRAIAMSPTDPTPVFDAILECALRLCRASIGGLLLSDGRLVSVGAVRGHPKWVEAVQKAYPRSLSDTGLGVRAVREGMPVHVADVRTEPTSLRNLDETGGIRAELFAPMFVEGRCIGAVGVMRQDVGLFSESEVSLVHTLAAQAAIAVENVRLFRELQTRNRELTESLEQQTATAEILRVISGSPTEAQPVFNTIVESAARLCEARSGALYRLDGGVIHQVAYVNPDEAAHAAYRAAYPRPLDQADPVTRRLHAQRGAIHIPDVESDPGLTADFRARARTAGYRSVVGVPLLDDGKVIGSMAVARAGPDLAPRPFSDREIRFLETFAAQAVIAIENVRLFQELEARNRELMEALEQQTATAEILRVISQSPTDTQPIFRSIVESAVRLCGGRSGALYQIESGMVHRMAYVNPDPEAHRALAVVPRPVEQFDPALRRLANEATVVHLEDVETASGLTEELRERARALGYRTLVAVPMLQQGRVIGAMTVARVGPDRAPHPFSEREIALLQTFVAQAVIAIDNTRLFQELEARNRELTESLEQQTATAEILRVISRSPTDTQPVFEAIAASAVRLCDGRTGALYRIDDGMIDVLASTNPDAEARRMHDASYPRPMADLETPFQRLATDATAVHLVDVDADLRLSDVFKERARVMAYRSAMLVPMIREGRAIGVISVGRAGPGRAPRPFSEREIALLQTFADQAVIAIENVRLFTELESRNRALTESLEQQTATAEILGVISRSPTDLQPVLESVVRNASRLCGAANVSLYRVEGDLMRKVADQGPSLTTLRVGETRAITRTTVSGRTILDRTTLHIPDYQSQEAAQEYPDVRRDTGIRTTVGIPLLREGAAIGVFTAYRTEARPFSEREIALLQTFAAQAVIAIENVRLFTELGARNRELTESLEQQTATGHILGVISSSPTDVQPVFDAIVTSAVTLCGGLFGGIYQYDGHLADVVSMHNFPPDELAAFKRHFPTQLHRGVLALRAIMDRTMVHVPDVEQDPEREVWNAEVHRRAGFRSLLAVPMLRDGSPCGAISVAKREPGPFPDRYVTLLQTFANQAVIAIENVRLFQELHARNQELSESLEQQTATGEILRVISSSPTDVQPVFDTIVESVVRLCDGVFTTAFRYDGELIHPVAYHRGLGLAALEVHERMYPRPPSGDSVVARAILDRTVVHVRDVESDPDVPAATRELARAAGYRSILAVPMLREGNPVGALGIGRRELNGQVRPFSDREIALVRTFADQAVIAIENGRLFQELEARNRELTESLEQQTATSEILRAISASPTDTQPVFDTIAQHAVRVSDGRHCSVFRFDGTLIHFVAHYGQSPEALEEFQRAFPLTPDADTLAARSIRDGVVLHRPDLWSDPSEPVRRFAQTGGYRTGVAVPMLRGGKAVGVIGVGRSGPGGSPRPFSEKEIALLQTFADQGVIAVENVRLFQELEARTRELARSVEELQALGEVGRAVSSTLDLPTVLRTIVGRAVQLSGTSSGVLYEYDEATETFHLQASHQTETEVVDALRASPIQLGEGATGRAVARRAPAEVVDLLEDQQFKPGLREILTRLGYRSFLSIPLLLEHRILGALTVSRREPGHFPPETVNLLQTFATQSALAIQNARLFREIEAKGRELEVASRHKSQFLANMSHELRTPLNAILGYTELMIDGIYGELSPKAGDVLARVDRSGKHLLGLINDVLDLSKIEAGQLELALADYSLAEIVNAVVTQVESLAAEKGLILQATVAPGLPAGRGDERRLAQVLLNLVGNAIKFTEVGSVRVVAHRDGNAFVVAVADTGPGIAEADRQRIFEEFQQADSSSTRKKGGTGLGLSIARRIIELHGGRIWVDSTVGRGSTFTFEVPVRVERQAARV